MAYRAGMIGAVAKPHAITNLSAVRRLITPVALAVAAAALVGLLAYGLSTHASNRSLDERLHHREHPTAPDANRLLPVLGGRGSRSLADLHGKIVVLNIWASWCPPCQAEAPLLERAQPALRRAGATILGIAYEDVTSDSEHFVRQFHLSYPNLRDDDGEFAHAYGTDQLPESFIIDRSGHIVAIERGEIHQGFMTRAIALARSA